MLTTLRSFGAALAAIDFSRLAHLCVAVSGGSDSVATLLALVNHVQTERCSTTVSAVTVDHGLRVGSAEEAEQVGALCRRLGVDHKVLRWCHGAISSRLQECARNARYDLLSAHCRAIGADGVVTGHTRDDLVETAAMRAKRGSSDDASLRRGDAGIAPATLHDATVWFLRPMVETVSRHELRRFLAEHGIAWIDDPSNSDMRFERVRLRSQVGALDAIDEGAIRAACRGRVALSYRAAALAGDENVLRIVERDRVMVACRSDDQEGHDHLLAVLTSMVGGQAHLPGTSGRVKLSAFAREGRNGTAFTVHGCLLRRHGDMLEITREPRRQGDGVFGFDRLLSCFDLPLAQTLRQRRGLADLPPCPLRFATH